MKAAVGGKVVEVDLRETMVDVSGQDIMTADKVTLRLRLDGTMRQLVRADASPATYRGCEQFLAGVSDVAAELAIAVRAGLFEHGAREHRDGARRARESLSRARNPARPSLSCRENRQSLPERW